MGVKQVFGMFTYPLIAVIIGIFIGFLYRIFIKGQLRDLSFKRIDISNAKLDLIKSSLSQYKGYSRIVAKKNVFVYITEYYIYVGLIIDEIGTIVGNSKDQFLNVKSGKESKEIENEIPYFRELILKLESILGKSIQNKYIITGDTCLFLVECNDLKPLKFKDVYYTFIKQDQDKVYTVEEINSIASKFMNCLM